MSQNINPGASVSINYPIHLRCSNNSGISWKISTGSGSPVELTDSSTLTQNDVVMVTTNGSTSGLLKCLIVDSGSRTSRDTYSVGILVIASPIADITMTVQNLTVNEGTVYISMPNWTEIFMINLPDENPIDSSMELISSDTTILNTYRQMIQAYSGVFMAQIQFDPVPRDVNQNVAAALQIWSPTSGSWITQNSMYTAPGLSTNIRAEYHYRLRLSTSYNGEFRIIFTMQDNQVHSLIIEVVAVNDAPTFKSFGRRGVSEPIESLLLYPYSGSFTPVNVGDLASAIYTDEEGDTLGLAFIGFTSTHIGTWQYLLNSNWETFTNLGSNVQPTQNVTVTLLSATDKIRFQPNNVNVLWSQLEAQRYTQLLALASDGTGIDTIPTDKSYQIYIQRCDTGICGMGESSSFSKEVVKLYMSRSGCDGKPGSKLENDRCGECGGSDTCVDCSGIVNGDCGDSCEDEHYIHPDLQMCLPNNTDVKKLLDELTGCDNVLHSGAIINECGHCVLGTTNKTVTHGLDECGICNGNNTSCTDCNGVVNGNHVVDDCGSCLILTDPTFNIGCVKIVSITPSVIGASGSRTFEIKGANLTSYESVSCQFVKLVTNQVIQLITTNFNSQNNQIFITTPVLSSIVVGLYSVRCTFDQILTLTIGNQDVTIFDYPLVDEIIPPEMTLKQAQTVTLRGSGIVDTGYIQCAVRCPYTDPNIGCFSTELVMAGFVVFPGKRLNDSAVECDFRRMSAIRKAMGYSITVMLEMFNDDNKNMLSYVMYRVIAPAPQVRQSYIHSRYCTLTIQFDTYIEVSSCKDILSNNSWTHIAGQSDIRCDLIGDRVLIKLSRDSTLQPGRTLTLQPTVTKLAKSLSSYALYASGDFVVSEARVSNPIFRIVGPKVVGSCDPFTMTLIQKDVGCVTLTYNWTVTANDSNPSADEVADIERLQAKLNDLSVSTKRIYIDGDEVIPGSSYNFTVTIFNNRENVTYETSMIVKRSVDVQPIRVRLKVADDITQFDVGNVLRMRAGEIGFEWISQTNDFSFSDFADNPYALVKSNAMRGGTSYTISVNVYFKDQMDVSSTSEVTVYTKSNPLVVRIRGGEKIKTLASKATVLDASLSVDPDRNIVDTAYYVWSCEEETSGVTCFVIQNGQSVTLKSLSQQTSSTSSILTIPANLMSPDKRYKFTVRMSKGSRMGNFTTTIQVIHSLPPTIEIPVIFLTVNYDEPLRVTSIVTSTGPVTMYWDCEEDLPGYDFVELAVYIPTNQLFARKNEAIQNFKFSLYTASQLPPGAKFALRVTATNTENDLQATSNIYVTVNSPPEIGDFSVSPANGTALETEFELTIGDGWSDSENDALYFTFFTRKTGESWIQLNTRGLVDVVSYSFITTSGIHDVRVKVCDSSGACSVKDKIQVLQIWIKRQVQYGSDIQNLYTFWNCTNDGTTQCYGACLASAQMTMDLVTVTSSTGYGELVQRSNVVFLKMINPETYNFMTVTNLTAPIDCMMWKSSNWTNETCTSYGYAKAGANCSVYEVRCSCYETGILSVFEGPVQDEIITTEAETTETGSIIVTFAILKRSSQTEDTIGVILARLQDKVQTETLTITDHNGQVLTVDTQSFKWSLTPYSYGGVDVLRKPGNIQTELQKAEFSNRGRINVQPALSKPGNGKLPLPEINKTDRFKDDNTDMNKVAINGKEDRFKQDDTDVAISIAGDDVIRQSRAESGVGTNSGSRDNVPKNGNVAASSVGVGIGGGMSSNQNTETETWIEKEIKTGHEEETRSVNFPSFLVNIVSTHSYYFASSHTKEFQKREIISLKKRLYFIFSIFNNTAEEAQVYQGTNLTLTYQILPRFKVEQLSREIINLKGIENLNFPVVLMDKEKIKKSKTENSLNLKYGYFCGEGWEN
ncbi:LOW QUALITY PROTEIN: hypothetical protein KUTeg_019771 [Tegillarca granosa]|uniref:PKD/REJ-like domain-containing protein n=1 Tax=Tegillarca granosa TaxID=220873 RepID=A0ABQ9EJ02_TEGGR|nr:LOW QUALITY PROTEIN: hypothetical protein KUTeg_019771 [Tegillarca granosa]